MLLGPSPAHRTAQLRPLIFCPLLSKPRPSVPPAQAATSLFNELVANPNVGRGERR